MLLQRDKSRVTFAKPSSMIRTRFLRKSLNVIKGNRETRVWHEFVLQTILFHPIHPISLTDLDLCSRLRHHFMIESSRDASSGHKMAPACEKTKKTAANTRVSRVSWKRSLPCLIQHSIMDRGKILANFEEIEWKLWILRHDILWY